MSSIELKTFVKQALLEIIEGVVEAQKVAPTGSIAPSDIDRSFTAVDHNVSHLQPVSFEVKVVVEKNSGTEAKIGVLAGVFGGSAGTDAQNVFQAHSTLKFTIPIHLPLGGPSRND